MKTSSLVTMVAAMMSLVSANGEFSSDTLAFYTFNDGTGDVGSTQLANAVDESVYAGSATVVNSATGVGSVTFDDDVPGKYIFDDVSQEFPEPIVSGPQSIYLTSSTDTASGGRLSFEGIGTALSGCSEGTVEFFFKIPADEAYKEGWRIAAAVDLGAKTSSGTARSLGLGIPVNFGDYREKYAALVKNGDANWNCYAAGSSNIGDGNWHHVALVMTTTGFKVVLDRTATSSEITGLVVSELSDSRPLQIGSSLQNFTSIVSRFHGKISCVRVSSKALTTDQMLKASELPYYRHARCPERIDMRDALALYTFKIGQGAVDHTIENGESLFNDVLTDDQSAYKGTVTKESTRTGELLFDDDAPGPYVFTSTAYGAIACVTNPMSINFSGTNPQSTVNFADIGTALSTQDEFTVEFFWKLPTDGTEASWRRTMTCDFGLRNSTGGLENGLAWYVPLANNTDGNASYRRDVRICGSVSGVNVSTATIAATYPRVPEDGLWHHEAVTYSNGTLRLYADYVQKGATISGWSTEGLSASKPFVLGNCLYRGKISLFRVSKKAYAPENFLHVSSLPRYMPDVAAYWRMEGEVGSESGNRLANDADTYQSVNTNLFFWSAETAASGVVDRVHVERPMPTYRRSCPGTSVWAADISPVADLTSLYLKSKSKNSGGEALATAAIVRSAESTLVNGASTVEGFFRFDKDGYMARIGSLFGETCNRVSLITVDANGASPAWKLFADNVATAPLLTIAASCSGGSSPSATCAIGSGFWNAWRHIAVVYDEAALKIAVWYDYQKVIELNLPSPLDFGAARYYVFGNGGDSQPFDGWIDELRVWRRPIDVSEFLYAEGRPGMLMILR